MWKLSNIRIENIVSFQEAEMTVEQGVATLIFGKNEDNALQPCNGSGKSSLIEAIAFALTGEQLREVKSVEEIINDLAEEAYVRVKLENSYDNTVFTIERTISRTAPQRAACHKYAANGEEIETDKTVQPTVADYNKFILSEVGLTKGDIYSNYILCDSKYESFFGCPDKSKKEIINRFSNGAIVDESIARVQADIKPVEARLNESSAVVAGIKGSISAIEAELEQVDEKMADAKRERQQRIERIDGQIQKCREGIEAATGKRSRALERLETLRKLQGEIADVEESGQSLLDAYKRIQAMCADNGLGDIQKYDKMLQGCQGQLAEQQFRIKEATANVEKAAADVERCRNERDSYMKDYQSQCELCAEQNDKDKDLKRLVEREIVDIDERLDQIESQIKANKEQQAKLDVSVARSKSLLEGAVVCPKCQHKFFVNETATVDDVQRSLADDKAKIVQYQLERERLCDEFKSVDAQAEEKVKLIEELDANAKNRTIRTDQMNVELRCMDGRLMDAQNVVAQAKHQLAAAEGEVDRLNGRIDAMRARLFDEINGMLANRMSSGKSYLEQSQSSIDFAKGQMKQYRQAKKELLEAPETDFAASLKVSLARYGSQLEEAEAEYADIKAEYGKLKAQEMHFTMFKSYIARKKIDALSLVVNDFLEKIGSDIRLRLEGFTVTKAGKLRDKISVQVMRDGIDCGSFHKFSGGEKARLNLACILSLHTLTNSNCDSGKGLDFIVIDEVLDKSDETGMAAYCEALNKLGQAALLITQGGVAEGYPHRLLITKRQGVSTISK